MQNKDGNGRKKRPDDNKERKDTCERELRAKNLIQIKQVFSVQIPHLLALFLLIYGQITKITMFAAMKVSVIA